MEMLILISYTLHLTLIKLLSYLNIIIYTKIIFGTLVWIISYYII